MIVRAYFDGNVFVPTTPVDLVEGQIVEIEIRAANLDPPRGSPAALLKAMEDSPRVSSEDVDELLRVIEEGKLPPIEKGCFDDE